MTTLYELLKKEENELSPLQKAILDTLETLGPLTRDEICKSFGYWTRTYKSSTRSPSGKKHYLYSVEQYEFRTTIYENLEKLRKKGLVEKFQKSTNKPGRPPVFWKIV